ncbi:endoribonuclease L-PSP [mine drainage metagenome]|uniref:Endoribonuclease L-PSP n=1 Tax=mine drainage metagenome TaxID=410659 RepID=A0A1J5TV26_9ZZZZ
MALQTTYMSSSGIFQQIHPWQKNALGAICFMESSVGVNFEESVEIPRLQLHAPILDGAEDACEIWLNNTTLASKPLRLDSYGAIRYRFNDEFLFGRITLCESESQQGEADISPLQQATESAYRQIFALMNSLDYPYAYRFWNYMANINGISHGLERYRQFNVGRKDAFLASGHEVRDQLPAACALGLVDTPLNIAFLLGRKAPIAIENPRQVSAYEYPEEYGPSTPSFSRATLLRTETDDMLFISGTASIVGHQTLHQSDVVAQTRETLANLDAVITEANRILNKKQFNLQNIFFRVYVRHTADFPLVRNEMQRYIGGTIKAVFVQADICRQELLLEIEATAGHILELVCTQP